MESGGETGHLVGASSASRRLEALVRRIGPTAASVLILGETGVGKNTVAQLLHEYSPRRERPFVVVECLSLHEELLQNELFGHERGAYTGAVQRKHGLFETAESGTIFLDEIGDICPATQGKLLRVLETGRFRRLGGNDEIQVDVRVLAATNRDLPGMVRSGGFRKDLFYRLSALRIEVPPLRARSADIAALAQHFLARMNARLACDRRLAPEAMAALERYDWPGNVRELIHAVERTVILASANTLEVDDLPEEIRSSPLSSSLVEPLRATERRQLERALAAVDGNRSRAASLLGISERTLYRRLKSWHDGRGRDLSAH